MNNACVSLACVLLLACQVLARPGHTLIQKGDDTKNAVDDAGANKINALKTTWRAKVSDEFRGSKVSDVKRMVCLYLSQTNFFFLSYFILTFVNNVV